MSCLKRLQSISVFPPLTRATKTAALTRPAKRLLYCHCLLGPFVSHGQTTFVAIQPQQQLKLAQELHSQWKDSGRKLWPPPIWLNSGSSCCPAEVVTCTYQRPCRPRVLKGDQQLGVPSGHQRGSPASSRAEGYHSEASTCCQLLTS